ncbi:hypothetical protein CXF68_17900 [Tenacibaculum sp. Bg11-29]|uniref:WG repeat-containing protein n=1 Tax=Tenacibaculum sp. Bg11-29 TaxID=2058306 RepID=UPI000C34034A|nr:WG repeat-containing protein [Tenacibaculum sp. Bg11-29]PKH52451.1 hypothetical protein CXF68_17900 [Tenacibaculum sp. Bg11-29]
MKIYKENKKFGLRLDNNIILEPKFDYIYYINHLKLYLVFIGKYKWDWSEESYDFFDDNKPWVDRFGDDDFIGELKNGKFGIVDKNGKEVLSPNLTYINYPIQEIGENLFTVNKGARLFKYDAISIKEKHRICIGGKWGVLTTKSKIIVPIEYDEITILRDDRKYIFAQNNNKGVFDANLEYDVYNFNGKLLLEDKPNYLEHLKTHYNNGYN